MKILSLRVEQFKKFDQAVTIKGFGDGLNMVTGPNETGKSTLLLALRAALFERHGAKTQTVKDFSPHNVTGARPTVTLDFEVGDERYRLEKSFLKRPAARLETTDGRRYEGSEAEAELKRLLGLDPSEKTTTGKDSPAHFGVLLTPQARSFQQPDLADGTRHSLEAAIAEDIAELGNQSEVDSLIAEFDEMLFDIVSKRGEPKNRYKDVLEQLAEFERDIAETRVERDRLRDEFERLAEAMAKRNTLLTAENTEKLAGRLASLETVRTETARRQTLENRRLEANQRLQVVETKRVSYQNCREKRQQLTTEIETLKASALEKKERLSASEERVSEWEGRLTDLIEKQRAALEKQRDLEALGQQFERLGQIEATLQAFATDVRLELNDDALDHVSLDGEPPLATSDHRQVTEGLLIEIDGIGRIGIEPKIEPMREALSAKAEAEGEIRNRLERLGLEETEPEMIETVWRAIDGDIADLDRSRTEIETALAEERQKAAEAKAMLDASLDRQTRLAREIAEIDHTGDEAEADEATLNAEVENAKAALKAANEAFQALAPSSDPDTQPAVETLDAEIRDLRIRIEEQRRAVDDANQSITALEAAINVRSDFGLDEKIDRLERQRHLMSEDRDAFALDHQALSLLQSTLRAAADEAKATFNAPLSSRLAPYIQDLFPSTTPVVTPEFSIRAIDRNGVEEPFLQLSDGTREQIAILARLAFADMLKEQGLPALIVLDDALAFSDDQRLARMIAILEMAAKRMQIIVLTCRDLPMEDIDATRLQISSTPKQAVSAA